MTSPESLERTKTIPDGGVERAVLLAGREVYLCVFELFAVCGMKKVADKCLEFRVWKRQRTKHSPRVERGHCCLLRVKEGWAGVWVGGEIQKHPIE